MTPGTVYEYLDEVHGDYTMRNFYLFSVDPSTIRGKTDAFVGDYYVDVPNCEWVLCLYERHGIYKDRTFCDRLVLTSSGQLGWVLVGSEEVTVLIDPSVVET